MDSKKHDGEFPLRIGDALVLKVRAGEMLIDVCDRHETPIPFSCRAASCGTCAIKVLQGLENLSPRSELEDIIIEDLPDSSPSVRLACQVELLGQAHIIPLP
jgi:2Fe-2S ferredoxin